MKFTFTIIFTFLITICIAQQTPIFNDYELIGKHCHNLYELEGNVKKFSENVIAGVAAKNYYKETPDLEALHERFIDFYRNIWEMNEDGKVLFDEEKRKHYYNSDGYLIRKEITRVPYGDTIIYRFDYTYNANYTELEKIRYILKNEEKKISNRETKKRLEDGSIEHKKYEYKEGKEVLQMEFYINSDMTQRILIMFPNERRKTKYTEIYNYDKKGNYLGRTTHDEDNPIPRSYIEKVYNEDNLCIQTTSYIRDKSNITYTTENEYNDKGLKKKSAGFIMRSGKKEEFLRTFEYLYDKKGNWIMQLFRENGEIAEFRMRLIEYWQK